VRSPLHSLAEAVSTWRSLVVMMKRAMMMKRLGLGRT
jgi:hypothetical protein